MMNKLSGKDIKIFDGGTVKEVLSKCLSEGYIPATLIQINQLIKDKIITDDLWYDTRTTNFNYCLRNLTLKELRNIEDFYNKGGRVLFVSDRCNNGYLDGYLDLYYNGRFVGVKVKKYK